MALRCIGRYRAGDLSIEVGQVVDNPRLEAHLLIDSPGSFEVVVEKPATKLGGQNKALTPQVTKAEA